MPVAQAWIVQAPNIFPPPTAIEPVDVELSNSAGLD